MESVEYKNISFTVWDVGGQDKVRKILFEHFPLLMRHPMNFHLIDPSFVETLLPEHSWNHLRCRFQRSRSSGCSSR